MLLVCSQSQPCDGQRTATEAGGPWSWEPAALTSSSVSPCPGAHSPTNNRAARRGARRLQSHGHARPLQDDGVGTASLLGRGSGETRRPSVSGPPVEEATAAGPVGRSVPCSFPTLCERALIVNSLEIKSLYALSFPCNFCNNP